MKEIVVIKNPELFRKKPEEEEYLDDLKNIQRKIRENLDKEERKERKHIETEQFDFFFSRRKDEKEHYETIGLRHFVQPEKKETTKTQINEQNQEGNNELNNINENNQINEQQIGNINELQRTIKSEEGEENNRMEDDKQQNQQERKQETILSPILPNKQIIQHQYINNSNITQNLKKEDTNKEENEINHDQDFLETHQIYEPIVVHGIPYMIPIELIQKPSLFEKIFSLETYYNVLSRRERQFLQRHLPAGLDTDEIVEKLFKGETFNHTNPIYQFIIMILTGSLHPFVAQYQKQAHTLRRQTNQLLYMAVQNPPKQTPNK